MSTMRRFLQRVPMSLLAVLVGLGVGAVAWYVVDELQTSALDGLLDDELQIRLDLRARESLHGFDQAAVAFATDARVLAEHRRMAEFLSGVEWQDEGQPGIKRYDQPPPWFGLPKLTLPSTSFVALLDSQDRVRQVYRSAGGVIPEGFMRDPSLYTGLGQRQVTRLDGRPYLIVAESARDLAGRRAGQLVVLVALDEQFLRASQARVSASNSVVLILDADGKTVLSSSAPSLVPSGSDIESLQSLYESRAQSFIDYGGADLNLLFATLVPRADGERAVRRVLDLASQQRLVGGLLLIGAFVLLFVFVSHRISRLLRRMSKFARRTLESDGPSEARWGNQLMLLEDWTRDFTNMVLRQRDRQRQEHEREIRESEALTEAVMAAAPDAIITIDSANEIVDMNASAGRVLADPERSLIGRPLEGRIVAADSHDVLQSLLWQASLPPEMGPDMVRAEVMATRMDGQSFPAELSVRALSIRERLFFTLYLRDVSQRKKQEEEILSLAAFPGESPMPMLRINRLGVILFANDAAEPLLRQWGCRRHQTLPVYWRNQIMQTLELGSSMEAEVMAEGRMYSVLMAPVSGLGYVNLYARDVTETRLAEEQARQHQNDLVHVSRLSTMGEMATGIAHELNQPLSAITNYARGCERRLQLGNNDAGPILEAVRQIAHQAERAGEIIRRLRGMVVRQQPVRQVVSINDLVDEVCGFADFERRKLQIAILRIGPEKGLDVRVDPVQIEQVLLNLLRNAFDAMEEMPESRRQLQIETGRTDMNTVFVRMADTGVGMSAEALSKMFDQFYTTKDEGMGMGLAISQTILQDHHGTIRAASEPGEGTVFTIELPLHQASVQELAS